MSETPEEMSPEELEVMRRRVKKVAGIALAIALALIALSALTLKAGQMNDLPRSTVGTR